MNWIPVSFPITKDMTVYKDLPEKRPIFENTRSFEKDGMYESTLHLPLHTGTHVDYPLHAISGGKCSSDYQCFPISFRAYVLDLTSDPVESIGLSHVKALPLEGVGALFLKTLKEPLTSFDFEFPWLTSEAAAWLSELPLNFVGIDQPGIERNQPSHETHIRLLEKDILIIEGLDLSMISEGIHDFIAFSLQIRDVEAEPVVVYALSECSK